MKPDENDERLITKVVRSTPQPEMEAAGARVLQRLRVESDDVVEERMQGLVSESAQRTNDPAPPVRRTRRWQWPAVAAAAAAVVIAVILPARFLQGAPAVLEDAEGKRSIQYGELVRPVGDMSAMLSMTDGARVETQSMSEFSLEPADDGGTRIRLKEGGLIVDASAENRANLYVQTKDLTALVSGAVSLVKAEEEGSRIAAIGGEIRVQQGTTEKKLRSGEQVATSPGMELVPVKEEIAWSREAAVHVAMLQQSASTTPPSPAGRPKFAAASVRQWPGGAPWNAPPEQGPNTPITCLGVDGVLGAPANTPPPAQARRGRCTGQSVPLESVVFAAYASSYMSGMAGYAPVGTTGFFQIEAVADDPERVTKGELKLMLQTLLEDRFKARVRLETRELDGYVLTIAKSGIKFKATPAEATPARCAEPNNFSVSGPCTMRDVVRRLERGLLGVSPEPSIVRVPVHDKTGLTGTYDIKFLIERPQGGGGVRGAGGGGQNLAPLEFSPPIPKQVEDQLGLRLEPGKVQVEFIVIDHLESPTEN